MLLTFEQLCFYHCHQLPHLNQDAAFTPMVKDGKVGNGQQHSVFKKGELGSFGMEICSEKLTFSSFDSPNVLSLASLSSVPRISVCT